MDLTPMHESSLDLFCDKAEEEANTTDINDQSKYLADQKVEVLKTLN